MKLRVLVALAALVLMVAGCTDNGILKVTNTSDGVVVISINSGSLITLLSQYFHTQSWKLKKSIFNTEEKTVNLSYTGYYVFTNSQNLKVTAGKTKSYNIEADAGVIQIKNNCPYNITHVYISPSSSPYWGDNQLSSILPPGAINEWMATPGTWDVKVRDASGYEGSSFYNQVNLNETILLIYTHKGSKTADPAGGQFTFSPNPDLEKQQSAASLGIKPSEGRIEEHRSRELYSR